MEFVHRLKSLLERAYHLQEEFEGVLGLSESSSHSSSDSSQGEWLEPASVWTNVDLQNSLKQDVHGGQNHRSLELLHFLQLQRLTGGFFVELQSIEIGVFL